MRELGLLAAADEALAQLQVRHHRPARKDEREHPRVRLRRLKHELLQLERGQAREVRVREVRRDGPVAPDGQRGEGDGAADYVRKARLPEVDEWPQIGESVSERIDICRGRIMSRFAAGVKHHVLVVIKVEEVEAELFEVAAQQTPSEERVSPPHSNRMRFINRRLASSHGNWE
ncbi:hypothetical protein B0H17DRAFT_1139419 [Mycena rosella]|uniref:Uncharacterized protein n=1 Tax=Mycena rosella TaxID=1033263 RepID=A0AAD7GCG5_MYCRO|nr:hypothetical protein B0H17DRAFT_1139419 [Mycena rosella]